MKPTWPDIRWRRLAYGAAVGLVMLAATCAFLRISGPRTLAAYWGMASECHPVWRQFAFRRFGAGASAAQLLQRYPPTRSDEFGHYGVYRYYLGSSNGIPFTCLSVIARDGKLLSAGAASCTWRLMFFSTEDPEVDRQYVAYAKQRHEKFQRERLRTLEAQLEQFYSGRNRWPTNQEEFARFVTGRRTVDADELGITMIERKDGVVDISLTEFPDERRSVTRPKQETQGNP